MRDRHAGKLLAATVTHPRWRAASFRTSENETKIHLTWPH